MEQIPGKLLIHPISFLHFLSLNYLHQQLETGDVWRKYNISIGTFWNISQINSTKYRQYLQSKWRNPPIAVFNIAIALPSFPKTTLKTSAFFVDSTKFLNVSLFVFGLRFFASSILWSWVGTNTLLSVNVFPSSWSGAFFAFSSTPFASKHADWHIKKEHE